MADQCADLAVALRQLLTWGIPPEIAQRWLLERLPLIERGDVHRFVLEVHAFAPNDDPATQVLMTGRGERLDVGR
jgi:hypothetical protein